jgi:hypothetical protein
MPFMNCIADVCAGIQMSRHPRVVSQRKGCSKKEEETMLVLVQIREGKVFVLSDIRLQSKGHIVRNLLCREYVNGVQ